jgi:hypothetical protein
LDGHDERKRRLPPIQSQAPGVHSDSCQLSSSSIACRQYLCITLDFFAMDRRYGRRFPQSAICIKCRSQAPGLPVSLPRKEAG